jgi:hypothetical protein
MTDPAPDTILVYYLDTNNVTQNTTIPVNQLNPFHSGALVYSGPDSTDPVFFVPWSRILAIENIDGGTMPQFL